MKLCGFDVGLVADKVKFSDGGLAIQGHFGAVDDRFRTPVAAHDIQDYAHKNEKARCENSNRAPSKNGLTEVLDRNDLAAFVKTASGTNAVGNKGSGALRACAQLRQRENAVVGAAHALAAA